MKVLPRILLSLALIVLLFSSILFFSLWQLQNTDRSYNSEISYSVAAFELIQRARDEYVYVRLLSREFFMHLGDDAYFDEAHNELDTIISDVLGYIDQIEALAIRQGTIGHISSKLALLRTNLLAYQEIYVVLIDVARQGDMRTFQDTMPSVIWAPVHVEFLDTFERLFYFMVDNLKAVSNYHAQNTYSTIVLSIAVIATIFLISTAIGIVLIVPIKKSLKVLMTSAGNISKGDFNMSLETDKTDEFSQLKNAFAKTIKTTENYIEEIADTLSSISEGDLTVSIERYYSGSYVPIKIALTTILESLNSIMEKMQSASSLVASDSRQIADSSNLLAQGANEQAETVSQLLTFATEVSDMTKDNAQMAAKAAELAITIKNSAEKGNKHMAEMVGAVTEINNSSQNISKVIGTIDEIAFQTNILALNASVEAARAGQHGKGFAVVAEEVRRLAAKSAEAARDTGKLISNSMEKSEYGARIATDTAESLAEIVMGINESSEIISAIALSSEAQSAGIAQISSGIGKVANVVEQNNSAAMQSASASKQLSGQSHMLEQLISQFRLKGVKAPAGLPPASRP